MKKIKAIITDFDGTLVDTFEANYIAYSKAFAEIGYILDKDVYKKNFGLKFNDLMNVLNIDKKHHIKIKELKSIFYKQAVEYTNLNVDLYNTLLYFKTQGCKICIASTASKVNLYNVLNYYGITNSFDLILTSEDVKLGKPNPEVYNIALGELGISPNEALVFEDSDAGCKAASNAEINYIKIKI